MIPLGVLAARRPATGSVWTPADLPGLWGWWDAAALTLTDSSNVETWPDMSGNGRDASQADAARQPVYAASGLNGLPTVVFTDDVLPLGQNTPTTSTTIFIVTQVTGTLTYNEAFSGSIGIGAANGNNINMSAKTRRDRFDAGSWPITPAVGAVQFDDPGTTGTIRLNGTQLRSEEYTQKPVSLAGRIGAYLPGDYWPGKISEVIVYASALSNEDMALVESYLMTKWGI